MSDSQALLTIVAAAAVLVLGGFIMDKADDRRRQREKESQGPTLRDWKELSMNELGIGTDRKALVRIISADQGKWYRDRIGEEFTVMVDGQVFDRQLMDRVMYRVYGDFGVKTISGRDVELVSILDNFRSRDSIPDAVEFFKTRKKASN